MEDANNNQQQELTTIQTNTSTNDNSNATTPSSLVTAVNSRTTPVESVSISTTGAISIDGREATNAELESYFDYSKYPNQASAKIVEGIFKSDTVTINDITYKAELNANGEMVSIGGTSRLTREEIENYFGNKGYEALVCKATKNVSVDENGKVTIKDRDEIVNIRIPIDITATNNSSTISGTNITGVLSNSGDSLIDKLIAPTTPSSGRGFSGGRGGYSGGGGGGGYSGGGGSSGGSSSAGTDEVEKAGTPVIMVEFGKLQAIRDDLQSLKGQLSGICDDYGGTIDGLSNNGDAWSGVDKDKYISQKKGYVSNIKQVSSTLDSFVSYLDTCVNNYQQLEAKLAAKQIS